MKFVYIDVFCNHITWITQSFSLNCFYNWKEKTGGLGNKLRHGKESIHNALVWLLFLPQVHAVSEARVRLVRRGAFHFVMWSGLLNKMPSSGPNLSRQVPSISSWSPGISPSCRSLVLSYNNKIIGFLCTTFCVLLSCCRVVDVDGF